MMMTAVKCDVEGKLEALGNEEMLDASIRGSVSLHYALR
jgi:hypothetical protein